MPPCFVTPAAVCGLWLPNFCHRLAVDRNVIVAISVARRNAKRLPVFARFNLPGARREVAARLERLSGPPAGRPRLDAIGERPKARSDCWNAHALSSSRWLTVFQVGGAGRASSKLLSDHALFLNTGAYSQKSVAKR